MFPEQQIRILEWFLKDQVTLKTGVMVLKIQFCVKNKIHIQIQNSFFKLQKNIADLFIFVFFDQINAALMSIRVQKVSLIPNFWTVVSMMMEYFEKLWYFIMHTLPYL